MGTIKTTNIETITGSGTLTIGQSGETINIPSGCTITNNGTQTGFGGTMTPAFHVSLSAIQQTTDLATTKVQFDTESFDTDNCFDNSTNYRFTPTVAGKYFIYTSLSCRSDSTNQLVNLRTYIYKNGSELIKSIGTDFRTNNGYQTLNYTGAIIEMNGSTDYIEFFARVDHQGGTNGGVDAGSYAGSYKIIE